MDQMQIYYVFDAFNKGQSLSEQHQQLNLIPEVILLKFIVNFKSGTIRGDFCLIGPWLKKSQISILTDDFYIIFESKMNPEKGNSKSLLDDKTKLVQLINKLINDILSATLDMPKGSSKFHAKQVPGMSVRDYLISFKLFNTGISKYTHCSNASYVLALIYIDRLQDQYENLVLNMFCIHKLLITSIVLAAKYNDDQFYKNAYYAKVGGISLEQMNMLENTFSDLLNYNFFVKAEDFNTYLQKLAAYDGINE